MPSIPCNIHLVGNAFRVGICAYGEACEELTIDRFHWLQLTSSPSRRGDYINVSIVLDLMMTYYIDMYNVDGLHSFLQWTELSRNEKQQRSPFCNIAH